MQGESLLSLGATSVGVAAGGVCVACSATTTTTTQAVKQRFLAGGGRGSGSGNYWTGSVHSGVGCERGGRTVMWVWVPSMGAGAGAGAGAIDDGQCNEKVCSARVLVQVRLQVQASKLNQGVRVQPGPLSENTKRERECATAVGCRLQ